MPRFIVVVAVVLTAAGPVWGETPTESNDGYEPWGERYELWADCNQLILLSNPIKNKNKAAIIGLTDDDIMLAIKNRLRAAGLYGMIDRDYWKKPLLVPTVMVESGTVVVKITLLKVLKDVHSSEEKHGETWSKSFIDAHRDDASIIIAALGRLMDEFIDEYLRVNEEACEAKAMSLPQ